MTNHDVVDVLFEVINQIKRTAFSADVVGLDSYLGGDLGIDSREMLEIFYDLEKKLNIEVHDYEKRDLYLLSDVLALIEKKLEPVAN